MAPLSFLQERTAMANSLEVSKTVRSVCPYCGVGCGIVMQVENNLIVKVSGDKHHPSNFGRLCTKGSTCAVPVANSGRMEHAFMRQERNRDPARIGMDQAIQATASRLRIESTWEAACRARIGKSSQ